MPIDYNFVLRSNPSTHQATYPNSYYAATANKQADHPELTETIQADVCIIGGGFSGINTAIELREAGLNVVLIEARKMGWGASGRNGGQVLRGIGQNNDKFINIIGQEGIDTLERMGDEAIDIVVNRIKKHGIECDLKFGSTSVALKPRHMREIVEYQQHLERIKYPHSIEITEQQNLAEVVGSDHYIGAITLGGDAHVHPLNLCLGEAQVAADLGVQLFENTPAIDIKEGAKIQVTTEKGAVHADFAVMCGNAYTKNMHKTITSKILPAGSYIIATEPLGKLADTLLPKDSAVCDLNYALDYFRLSKDKRLLFGGLCNYSGRDPSNISEILQKKMLTVFPQLKETPIDYYWGGMIGVGINRLPQIGRIGHNLYYAQGYAGHGVNATHIAARIIAESITAQSHRIDLFEKVKHHTFPGGPQLQSVLFSLGMLYFRLKDAL